MVENYKWEMIVLLSDFGDFDPYVGLMKTAIFERAPNCLVIDICHNLPVFNPDASGRLLQMLVSNFPKEAIVLAIVDPGVGTDRNPLWLEIDGRHFIGPDNGLFARIVNEARKVTAHIIEYEKSNVSASFHGRDVFAPFAANLEIGNKSRTTPLDENKIIGQDWPIELAEIIYIDHYGNAMTGISAASVSKDAVIKMKNLNLQYSRTFAATKELAAFWYENSIGLVELSMYQASIAAEFKLKIGDKVSFNLVR